MQRQQWLCWGFFFHGEWIPDVHQGNLFLALLFDFMEEFSDHLMREMFNLTQIYKHKGLQTTLPCILPNFQLQSLMDNTQYMSHRLDFYVYIRIDSHSHPLQRPYV